MAKKNHTVKPGKEINQAHKIRAIMLDRIQEYSSCTVNTAAKCALLQVDSILKELRSIKRHLNNKSNPAKINARIERYKTVRLYLILMLHGQQGA
jgi:hypothetical protein